MRYRKAIELIQEEIETIEARFADGIEDKEYEAILQEDLDKLTEAKEILEENS